MSILIISSVFPPEPVVSAKIACDLALELSKKEKVIVLCPKPTRPFGFVFKSDSIINESYMQIFLHSYTCPQSKMFGRFRESVSMGIHTSKYIKKNHCSIGIIYNCAWPLFGQFLVAKAANRYGIPLISPVQDIYPESLLTRLPKWNSLRQLVLSCLLPIDKYVLRHSDKVHVISENMKLYLVKTRCLSENNVVVVNNWQDENEYIYNAINYDVMKPFTFMYLGNIGPLAGIDFVIDAFGKVNITNTRLVIAGAGSMKSHLQIKALQYPASHIEFWDVPNGKVAEIQNKADVMLLPIKRGGSLTSIPSKLPAYMFSKKPVIACVDHRSDTALAIEKSACGWILEPENENDLINCMVNVIKFNKSQLVEMGNRGFEYAIEHFSKKENLKKVISIFESLIENKRYEV